MAARIAWFDSGAGRIALGAGELDAGREGRVLVDGARLDEALLLEQADERAPCRGSAGRPRGSARG